LWQAFNTVFNDWLDLLGADAEENHQAHRV
jgi:hypothetical protein